jgi:hypothetical protein
MSGMPDLAELIKSAAPRERAGGQTQARYDFQANYSILKIVELQESGQDFRIFFDLFDDIMVVDSATAPTEARFYQLKSKDPGDWTIPDVCRKLGAKAPRSIISRLYAHVVSFGTAVMETGLVSNAAYKMKLMDGSTTSGVHHRIAGTELHTDEIEKIAAAVNADIDPADVPSWLPKLAFIRTTLGVHGQELVVIGRLQTHLEQIDGTGTVKTSALYRTLHAAIVQRTTFSQEGIDHADLLSRKSLERKEIEELLASVSARPRGFVEDWEIILSDLESHGIGSVAQIRLKTAAITYMRDRNSDRGNAGKLSASFGDWIKNNSGTVGGCDSILQIADLAKSAITEHYGYSDLELRAAMIVEAYEATNVA